MTENALIDVTAAPKVAGPAVHSIVRAPGSVRRTSTIDMSWPAGWGTAMLLQGRARDLLTPRDASAPTVLAENALTVEVTPDRTITAIGSDPARPSLAGLVGSRGGGRLRSRIVAAAPDERAGGTPLYLLLDDLAGATLIGGFAYSQWREQYPEAWTYDGKRRPQGPVRRMEGICTGFQTGSSGLDAAGSSRFIHDIRSVPPLLAGAEDSFSWHSLIDIDDVSMRRARRIDVRVVDGVLEIDSMFQDSATTPDRGRIAVHEYRVTATADRTTGDLISINADPRVLPYRECPLAALNVGRMIGTSLTDFRAAVLEQLKGVDGCTHLNDAMRALAEAPVLVEHLS